MKSQETIILEIESDIQMTVKRRGYAYASEHAGWLDRAARRLRKVENADVRIELFLKIVRRALKLLRSVDDSGGSLQSVLWEGSACFDVWKRICQDSGLSEIKIVLNKVIPEDVDGLSDGLFFPDAGLPIAEADLRKLIDIVLDMKFEGRHRRERAVVGCLGWLAQLKDENGFNGLVKDAKVSEWQVWRKRFNLYLNLCRYDDAAKIARTNNESNPRYVRELMLQIFERCGDRKLLVKTALQMARNRPTPDEFKRLKSLLTAEELARFVDEIMRSSLGCKRFDMALCEVLYAAGELEALHSYAVTRSSDIYSLNYCTGMIPLAKKLFKDGDALAACVFMRGAVWYLMSKNNSRYYSDIHAHRRVLAEMASAVKDWESVQPQAEFDADFTSDFASRRSFWL